MAFVSAVPLLHSARASALAGRALSPTTNHAVSAESRPVSATVRAVPAMGVEFQTFSGGLDRVSIDPYTITRYLFKSRPTSYTEEEKDSVINAGLRHLFGNAHLMDEERAEFAIAESKFRAGTFTAKEFARAVAKSNAYSSRFFEPVSQFRFFELNFKHFFGRAPLNQVEYSKHFKIFANGGYEAEIDSFFDDPEYDEVFGEDVLPYTRFRGTYAPINQFNRMCTLEGGYATSDKNRPVMLMTSLAANVPTRAFTVADGLPNIPNAEHPTVKYDLPDASLERFRNELEIAKARALQCQIDLSKAYKNLEEYRAKFSTFTSMVADMDISTMPGPKFQGPIVNFPTWNGVAPTPWGSAGVDRMNGPVKRPAVVVSKKEKQLERIKQLVLDLERKVAELEAGRESPAVTPMPMEFSLEGMLGFVPVVEKVEEVVELSKVGTALEDLAPGFDPVSLVTSDVDEDSDESGVTKAKEVNVVTSREQKDVGKLPKELMEELEAKNKAEGKEFGGPGDGRLRFPGDGSEMVIGG